jgi:hypothetical protein
MSSTLVVLGGVRGRDHAPASGSSPARGNDCSYAASAKTGCGGKPDRIEQLYGK